MGGMGNQMFQYAFGRYLSIINNTELKLDVDFLLERSKNINGFVFRDFDLSIFNIKANFSSKNEVSDLITRSEFKPLNIILNKLIGLKANYKVEQTLNYNPTAMKFEDNSYIDGYWQSENYFSPIKDLIKKEFSFKHPIQENCKILMGQINSTNSVCVNIRRADFVTNSFHGTCDTSYYYSAEKVIKEQIKEPIFYVFSDEIEWCKRNLKFSVSTIFIEHKYAGTKFQDYLRLMSACKNFVIPNSSFAWWAAYLSLNESKIVIAPKRWNQAPNFNTESLTLNNWILL